MRWFKWRLLQHQRLPITYINCRNDKLSNALHSVWLSAVFAQTQQIAQISTDLTPVPSTARLTVTLDTRVKDHVTYFLNFRTLHNFSTDEARDFMFSLLDWPWQVLRTMNNRWQLALAGLNWTRCTLCWISLTLYNISKDHRSLIWRSA